MMHASLLHFVQFALALVAVAANAVGHAQRQRAGVTPVQKVVELMEAMLVKGKDEKHKEQIQYAAYKQFCDGTKAQKNEEIKKADKAIVILQADVEKAEADVEKLGDEIAKYDKDVLKWTGEKKKATGLRKTEKATYEKTQKDYSESIDALNRAIIVTKEQSKSVPQAPSAFLQLSTFAGTKIDPVEARNTIEAFLAESSQQQQQDFQQGAEGSVEAAPEAPAYAFQSDGVIELLKKLLVKFSTEIDTLDKEEVSTQQKYDLLVQDLSANIEQATKDKDDKVGTKADKTQAAAKGKGDLRDLKDGKAVDVKYLKDLTATCQKKSEDFQTRQDMRADELEAIQKAIDIISGEAVAKVSFLAMTHARRQAQGTATVLAAVRSERKSPGQAEVAAYLQGQARALDSRVLEAAANYASVDKFGKVKKMIKDLLAKLMEEESSEAEKKGWCDTELAKNAQTREEKSEAVESLSAEIERLEASVVKGARDVAELSKSISLLDATMKSATKLRLKEETENKKTIEDAEAAQVAIAQATQLLKDFYNNKVAFMQAQPEAPAMSEGSYSGMKGESDGVLGMLEVITSDFSRLETSMKAAEANAKKEYQDLMSSSNVDKASKTKDEAHKRKKLQVEKQTLANKKEELELSQKELDTALAYFDKLKPDCLNSGVSYEDRVARRSQEIESLQEALKILSGDDVP